MSILDLLLSQFLGELDEAGFLWIEEGSRVM